MRWSHLVGALSAAGVMPRLQHAFLGLDGDGLAMLDDRARGRVRAVRPRALVLAVGAVERVLPRPGWQWPGVMTAGGLQLLLKEGVSAPDGDILIAGNGPLTIALAADLARLGRPPVALVEAGDPFVRFAAALRLSAHPGLVAEAASHLLRVFASRTPWLRGAQLTSIERRDGRLVASVRDRKGRTQAIEADMIALHDGIRPNDVGLPAVSSREPFVVRAGDCREALGIRAAAADGRHAARRVIALLSTREAVFAEPVVEAQRRAQSVLADLFRPVDDGNPLSTLPDETILCRCEGRTVGELRAMLAEGEPSAREIKLNGRFGMGLCQGRFCADNVLQLMASTRDDAGIPVDRLSRDRWPLRPVTIAALAADDEQRERS
ncbi:NAD(P)/FAD-dependent oxidoreductase [Aquibium carbonis]|uniref:NAD(P)/FAD-dependent oxidoreductase n=2 Tax=Aquibium carbonis TaxID=2495581 RepID=A0A429YU70_9HYPH|nr:NAD(P)/FAD-dependent oxidoreductase [Aquibium carbonis]